MEIITVVILAAAIIVFAWLKIGDIFSPWMITAAIWFAILFLLLLYHNVLDPLSQQFYICLSLWAPIFCLSSLITYHLLPSAGGEKGRVKRATHVNSAVFYTLFAVSMIITPLYTLRIMKIVTQFDASDLLYNIRILAVYGENAGGVLNYSFVINQALLAVALWNYPKVKKWILALIYAANILSCFAIMEKGGIFFIVTTTLFILYEKGTVHIRHIIVTIALLVVFFFLMTVARGSEDDEVIGNLTFVDFFAIYALSPSVAFGRVAVDLSGQFGSHTFEVLYLFLDRFGFDVQVNEKLQDFVWVPLPTNVFTIFQPFFQDFGYAGVAFFALIYGTASGWIYRLFTNGDSFGRCMYAYLVEVLLLQFYQENIFLSLVLVLQYIFFVFIMVQDKFVLQTKTEVSDG